MFGWRRFVLHLFIVSVLGPALVGGVYLFAEGQGNADLLGRLVLSLVGGFVLLCFIAPITITVGIVTYGLCWFVTPGVLCQAWLWALVGGAFGAAYGLMWADGFVHAQRALLVTSGAGIGLATGAILAIIWRDREE